MNKISHRQNNDTPLEYTDFTVIVQQHNYTHSLYENRRTKKKRLTPNLYIQKYVHVGGEDVS